MAPHLGPALVFDTIPQPTLHLTLIGQMDLRTPDASILPTGRKTRALLAMIALAGPRPVSRSRAARTLWSRRPDDQARASLRQELHRLQSALGPLASQVLDISRDQLQFRPGAVWVDTAQVRLATVQDPANLALLDGTLLDGLTGIDPALDAWIAQERDHLTDFARTVADQILRLQVDPPRQIAAANRLLAIDRMHEGAWRALLRAHAAAGDLNLALQTFERCRSILAQRPQGSPSAETERLIAEIRASLGSTIAADLSSHPAPAPNNQVRIGVLALRTVDPSQPDSRLGIELAEELTLALARFRWFLVVSTSHLSDIPADLLLEGTVVRTADRIRVDLRLLDLRVGGTIAWSHRYDRPAADLQAVQDEIAALAAAELDRELLFIEGRRAAGLASPGASAYHLTLHAISLIGGPDQATFMQARHMLARAVTIDPLFSLPQAALAFWHLLLISQGWATDVPATIEHAAHAAERAMMLDPRDARALAVAGHVLAYLQHRCPEAIALHDQALATNPNLPVAWALSGAAHMFAGDLETAANHLARFRRLTPMLPQTILYDTSFVYLALLRGEFAASKAVGQAVSALNPAHVASLKPLLSSLGHLNEPAEAARVRDRLLRLQPHFSIAAFVRTSPFRPHHTAIIAQGLRLAGIQE